MLYFILLSMWSLSAAVSSNNISTKYEFDYFVFSEQWPTSICKGINLTVPPPHHCKFGNNVTTWTVHGLWPTRNHSMLPSFCNNQSKFEMSLLNPILGDLMTYWTNLFSDEPLKQFWMHEWMKHGTCASSVPGFENEYHYFKKTLEIRKQNSLFSVLKKHGIVPRVGSYQYSDVLKAFGKNASLQCYYDKTIKTQYLSQIERCLSKDLVPIPCPPPSQVAAPPSSHDLVKRSVTFTQDGHHNEVLEKRHGGHYSGPRLAPCWDTEPLSYPLIHH